MSDKAEQLFTVNMVLGTVERQERPVLDGNRVGYKWRNVTIDKRGVAIDIGPWNPPLCWMEFPVSTDISVGRAPVALQRYWCAAYAEGKEGRDHDTANGDAGLALRDVMLAVAHEVAAERERCAKVCEQLAADAYACIDGERVLVRAEPVGRDCAAAIRGA